MRQPEVSTCIWSPESTPLYRYRLTHSFRAKEIPSYVPRKWAVWIGVNPSTASERSLDPTLRRVRSFSQSWGCDGFIMLNLFAWRSTDPAALLTAPDPIGLDNDDHIVDTVNLDGVTHVVAAWGVNGTLGARDRRVTEMLAGRLSCLGVTKHGHPRHPLYVKSGTAVQSFPQFTLDTAPQLA